MNQWINEILVARREKETRESESISIERKDM